MSSPVVGEEPFDVGAGECDVFEGVGALLDVGLYGEALGEVFLAVEVDFWLGAPGVLCCGCLFLHECDLWFYFIDNKDNITEVYSKDVSYFYRNYRHFCE